MTFRVSGIFGVASVFGAVFALLAAPAQALYIDVDSQEIVSEGGELFIQFDGVDAFFTTEVVVENTDAVVFDNQSAVVGDVFSLGPFALGEVVSFQFNVLNTGLAFFSGLASRNFDDVVHVIFSQNDDGTISLGFEDVVNGGDMDYNDLTATLFERNALTTPIPGAGWLMLSAGAGLAFAARRRRKRT